MKKIFALVLALMLVAGMVSALADNTALTITSNITGETGSVYSLYELLRVTAKSGDNYTYQVNTKYKDILSANLTGNPTTDADIYAAISALGDSGIAAWTQTIYNAITTAGLSADATINDTTTTNIEQGYWLIVETTPGHSADMGDGKTSTSKIIINTAGQATMGITTKESIPTVDKKITGVGSENMTADAAAVKVGDVVEYTLTATLGNNLLAYKDETNGTYNYYFEFSDTMSTGLTFKEVTEVKVNGVANTAYTQTPENNAGGQSLSVKWTNLVAGLNATQVAALQGATVTVKYTATVNDSAVITDAGNPNTVKIIYSNNPQSNDHGESKPDTVKVYTYKLVINKVQTVDGQEVALNGAGFTLYFKATADGTYAQVGNEKVNETGNTFEWDKLAPGYYKLEETTVPEGFNKANDIEFQVTEDVSGTERARDLGCTIQDWAVDDVAGTVTGKVLNQKGAELPSTGGIGTTLFYIGGSILVLAAVILLVTKRRMSAND